MTAQAGLREMALARSNARSWKTKFAVAPSAMRRQRYDRPCRFRAARGQKLPVAIDCFQVAQPNDVLDVDMSLELVLVFALSVPPSADALQSALDRESTPIRVSPSTDLQKQSGFLPVDYGGNKTGFYVTQLTYKDLTADYPQAKLSNDGARAVISFGFGGHFLEGAAAFRVASVLVSGFGARAFDTESANYMSLADVKTTAAACDEESKKQKAQQLSD